MNNTICFLFHDFKNKDLIRNKFQFDKMQFSIFLNYLYNKGFTVSKISLDRNSSEPTCFFSVDDGLKSAHRFFFNEIKKRNFTATFFVSPELIGEKDYLNWNEVEELDSCGNEIGSHGMTHSNLMQLNERDLDREISDSKKMIEDKLGKPVLSFSIPRGFQSTKIIDKIRQSGYKFACTSIFGSNSCVLLERDFTVVKRINVSSKYNLKILKKILDANSFTYKYLYVKENAKQALRNFIGPSVYIKASELMGKVI